MNNKIEKLQYFVGKVCSIMTTSINRQFEEKVSREHFVVYVQEIDRDGLWGTHPYNHDMVSYFNIDHIVSIHQEIELDPNNPEHMEMIKEYEKRSGKKLKPDMGKLEKKGEVSHTFKSPLPVIEKPAFDVDTSKAGDAMFVDIASLERLAEMSQRSFAAEDSQSIKNR